MLMRNVTVGDPQGLHAQLAHQLSQVAGGFSASVWVRHGGRRASLADPIQILALGVGSGVEVTVMADGLDEVDAIDAITELIGAPIHGP